MSIIFVLAFLYLDVYNDFIYHIYGSRLATSTSIVLPSCLLFWRYQCVDIA